MASFFKKLASLFTEEKEILKSGTQSPAIPILILAKKKIESGIFTRFFTRPGIVFFEILAYLITILLFLSAFFIWVKVDNFFDAHDTVQFLRSYFNETERDNYSDYSWISYSILVILLLPSIICFLAGRLITASRKRIRVFIEVEDLIDEALAKLKEKENA